MPTDPVWTKEKASSPTPSPHSSWATYMDLRLLGPFPWPQRSGIIHSNAQRWLQLSGMIPAIHIFSYTTISSPHSKCYNTPTSMRVVMDGSEYPYVIIPIIKRPDLGGYKKISTCKLWSYGYLKFSHPQLQLQQVYLYLDLYGQKGSLLNTTENITINTFLLVST